MSNTVRIACLQMNSGNDYAANLAMLPSLTHDRPYAPP